MEYHTVRPIRCKTCGTLITPLAEDYEQAIGSGMSVKDALDLVQLFNHCCRTAMMVPSYFPRMVIDHEKLYGESQPIIDAVEDKPVRRLELEEVPQLPLPKFAKQERQIQATNLPLPNEFGRPTVGHRIAFRNIHGKTVAVKNWSLFLT